MQVLKLEQNIFEEFGKLAFVKEETGGYVEKRNAKANIPLGKILPHKI